jgi:8-oxo-dGTP pyrophosphatase MutT (NUDIX family)
VSETTILELDDIEAIVEPFDWDFRHSHGPDIETIWQREVIAKPEMFNGRVLIQHRGAPDGRIFRCAYSETDYRTFLAWHRLGHPGAGVRNGFGMAALRASDGAFLLGEMGAHTANAGKIYFAAGTPDPEDIVDGRVDLAGSVLREMSEETGLHVSDVQVGEGWTAIFSAVRVAFMRSVLIALPAAEARAMMLERMRHLPEQELADIHIVRDPDDIDEARMPLFQQVYLRHVFAGSE